MTESLKHRLADQCTDFLLYLTAFKRNDAQMSPGREAVRQRLLDLLAEAEDRVHERIPAEMELWARSRYLLVVTADGIILNSDWPDASRWDLLENDQYQTAVGGERFFRLMEEPEYDDPRLLEVFYLCLGVGFIGKYYGVKSEVRDLKLGQMRQGLLRRLSDTIPRGAQTRLTPQAYEHLEPSGAPPMPFVRLLKVGAVLVSVILAYVVGANLLYSHRVREVEQSIRDHARHVPVAVEAGQGTQN